LVAAGITEQRSDENLLAVRHRLRMLCGIWLVGFTTFFVRQIVVEGIATTMRWNWGIVFAALATSAVLLTISRTPSRPSLRLVEALIFGGVAWFFAATIHFTVSHSLRPLDAPSAIFNLMTGTMWFCVLAFNYAILFPGAWRRVACVVSLLLAVPAAVMIYDRQQFPEIAAVVDVSIMTQVLMTLAMCGGAIVFLAVRFSQFEREAALARRFGQYRLKEQIGGGMGEVYLAEHMLLKRPCALKRIRPGQDTDPVTLARFEREVRATAELSHPHTVDIYDYGRASDGTFYYVMEYLWGLTLDDLVRGHGPLPASRVVFLLRQVCEALEEAHSAGLIHRDITLPRAAVVSTTSSSCSTSDW
jgi:eukaryotic-like serine/threonine-protein kinase